MGHTQSNEKVSVLWCDPILNIREINTRRGILSILNKARTSGFEAIALGIKTVSGHVIYDSEIAPRLLEWKTFRVPLDFDPIRVFLDEGRRRSLQVYVVYSTFCEGHMVERVGPIYSEHPEWQSTVYVIENDTPQLMPITDWAYGTTAFVNPLLKEVQDYEISVVKEFLTRYSVDGIIFDKARFIGIESDFSEYSRQEFEKFLGGSKLDWWPEDVYELQYINDEWEVVPGKFFEQWVEFRSQSIQSFFSRLIGEIKNIDPTLPIGNFVGSWYPTYYEYGVNWASETNRPNEVWASREYGKTAIAEKFNYSIVGCFFPRITMEEAEKVGADWWMSVEGGATIAMDVVNRVTPVYASVLVEQFKDDADQFKESLKTALNLTDGLYINDVSQIEKYKYWDEISSVLAKTPGGSKK